MFLLAGCTKPGDKFEYGKKVLLVTGTDVDPLVKFEISEANSSYVVSVSATDKVENDITIELMHDGSLVEAYNEANRTSYYPIPQSAVELSGSSVKIEAGKAISDGIVVNIKSTEDFVEGRVYMIPVTIKSVTGAGPEVLETSRTIYLRVSNIINFWSLDMNNTNLYSNFIFEDELAVTLPNFTYEIKCYINAWHTTPEQISRLCSFTSKDESKSTMLRFGENGQDINSLQWVNPGGNLISTTRFNTGQWYTLSMTYDGSSLVLYVDGVKDAEMPWSPSDDIYPTFQRFEIGMSWESYPAKQYFNGRMAEARVWNRALSASEIKLGICGVDTSSNGLVAYWKFNEGTGHIFHDATGRGYDIDWSQTVRDNTGNETLNAFDKSAYVNWLKDDNNNCSI